MRLFKYFLEENPDMVEADLTFFGRCHAALTSEFFVLRLRILPGLSLNSGLLTGIKRAQAYSPNTPALDKFKTNHANMGILLSMLAFFVFLKHILIISTSRIGIVDILCFPLNCQ